MLTDCDVVLWGMFLGNFSLAIYWGFKMREVSRRADRVMDLNNQAEILLSQLRSDLKNRR